MDFPIINLGSATPDLATEVTQPAANATYLPQSWGSM